MNAPRFQEAVLRRGEVLYKKIQQVLQNPHHECNEIAYVANMCFCSSATNDYYEKIGAESIGFVHQTVKHGPDGLLNGVGCEVKPTKGTSRASKLGVINDDSAMKLLKDHTQCQWLVALRVDKDGSRVHWAVVAPFSYWEQTRFEKIVKKLRLESDTTWKWGTSLPEDETQRVACLEDLVKHHKTDHYVRSSDLKIAVLDTIPKNEMDVWVHPEESLNRTCPIIRKIKKLSTEGEPSKQ
jgi:hypothetical protein